jgi:hypothetical protein
VRLAWCWNVLTAASAPLRLQLPSLKTEDQSLAVCWWAGTVPSHGDRWEHSVAGAIRSSWSPFHGIESEGITEFPRM